MTRRIATFVSVALVGVAVAVGATPMSAHASGGSLRNFNETAMCIGIDSSSGDSGALAKLFRCDGTLNQNYTFFGKGRYFHIKAGHSGKCLQAGDSQGAPVVQRRCKRGNKGQNFRKRATSNPFLGPFFQLQAETGLCIGVSGG